VSVPLQAKFAGTANPRHQRALQALMRGPISRERLDRVAGVSNGPQLISDLRALGLNVGCKRVTVIDRDGRRCQPGVYYLPSEEQQKVAAWMQRPEEA
jgi:hypothetical protein